MRVSRRAIVDAHCRRIPDAAADEHAVDVPGSDPVRRVDHGGTDAVNGEPIGAIVLSRLGLDHSDDTDLHVLEVVAGKAAAACENVGLYASMREAAEVSEALLSSAPRSRCRAASRPSPRCSPGRSTASSTPRRSRCGSVRRRDDARRPRRYTPVEVHRLAERPVPVSEPPFANNLDSRAVTVCEPGQAGALASHLETVAPGTTFAVVPVGEWAANRAAIVVQRGQRRGAPGRRDELMLLGIADQALLAMVTGRPLYTELEASFLATVEALGNALGTKDEYTGDHAQALVGLTTNVARRIGLTGPELRDITVAAALHDVGKIGVPASILAKPGPLSVEEWAVMRRHPELGAKIMEPVPALDGARRLVVACHEHWDGSGYPHGLGAHDIPLVACHCWL